MMKKKAIPILFASLLLPLISQAQESVTSAGGDANSVEGSIAYSVGQVNYVSFTKIGAQLNEGIQNPFEIVVVGLENANLDLNLSVFPNPTVGELNLTLNEFSQENYSYFLYDIEGKLIAQGLITESQTSIDFTSLNSATYLLKVSNNKNQISSSFQIIKK